MNNMIDELMKDSIKSARKSFNSTPKSGIDSTELVADVITQLNEYWGTFTKCFTFYDALILLGTRKDKELAKILKNSVGAGKLFAQFYLFNWCLVGSNNLLAGVRDDYDNRTVVNKVGDYMDILKSYNVTDHDIKITQFINKIDELKSLDDEHFNKQYKKSSLLSLLKERNGKESYDNMFNALSVLGSIIKPIWNNDEKMKSCRKAILGIK